MIGDFKITVRDSLISECVRIPPYHRSELLRPYVRFLLAKLAPKHEKRTNV